MPPVIRRGYVDNCYGQMHYRMAKPDGMALRPPLLCLHQTPVSGWEWEPIMPGLAEDRVVLAPDTPGYGASDAPPEPVRIEEYAEAFVQLTDKIAHDDGLGEGPDGVLDILGYHTGSITATEIARRWPQRVRRLVLIGLAAYDAEARKTKLDNLGIFPTPRSNDLFHVTRLWNLMSTMVDGRAQPAWRHAWLAQGLLSGGKLPWGFSAVYRYDFISAMAEVKQPVMIINLEDDLKSVTSANAHRFANGRRVDMPGASHGVLALESERMVDLIRDFLDG